MELKSDPSAEFHSNVPADFRTRRPPRIGRWLLVVLALLAIAGGGTAVLMSSQKQPDQPTHSPEPIVKSVQLAEGSTDRLELSPQLVRSLKMRIVQAQSAGRHNLLNLSGSLFIDPNRLVHVHARFPGEVVSIAPNKLSASPDKKAPRPLRLGDRVEKGQLLAVIWSKDVGEKKSDLVNARSQLFLDRAQLQSLKALGNDVVGKQKVREAERQVEADIIEVDRVERTLRSWRLTEEEIKSVRAEADNIHRGDLNSDIEVDKRWAEIEVRSPFDGVVLEKNIVAGDIVGTDLDLFKIADLSVLGILANAYEEDLPSLQALPQADRRWTIYLKAQPDAPGLPGTFDLVGNIVDPNQHTAAVIGWLDNKQGQLRAGQFITAAVELPNSEEDVVLPDTAVIQEGSKTVVYVASCADGTRVARRSVALSDRGHDVVYIRSKPTPQEAAAGCEPLAPGEWVVAAGAIELDGALANALATLPPSDTLKN